MTLQLTHPSRSKLRAWLAARMPSPKVTTHVETCERCASRLLELADKETNGADKATEEARLAQIVKTTWAPPADLTERVIRSIDERERNERDLNVVLGLFGVATETASLMLPPDSRGPAHTSNDNDDLDGRMNT
ncbi:MAG: hypothetical protein HKN44_14005 [Ilumatobacter sp.]|nr:hypothetical protein [Ilumatobacter sp.]